MDVLEKAAFCNAYNDMLCIHISDIFHANQHRRLGEPVSKVFKMLNLSTTYIGIGIYQYNN